jgi:hypothetical protein
VPKERDCSRKYAMPLSRSTSGYAVLKKWELCRYSKDILKPECILMSKVYLHLSERRNFIRIYTLLRSANF